jgi:hypothetical protein
MTSVAASWPAQMRARYDKATLLETHPTIKAWFDAHKSGEKVWRDFPRFMAWRVRNGLSGDPDEWIEECLHGTNETLVRHASTIKRWAESTEFAGDKTSARERYAKTMKGFYLYHMIRLPAIRISGNLSETDDIEIEMTAGVYLDMLKRVLTNAKLSLRDRTIIMCQVQSGMDNSTFSRMFNFQGFPALVRHFGTEHWENWDEDKVPVRIDLIRPKTGVRHYTFLHHDSVMLLKAYLNQRSTLYGAPKILPPRRPTALPTSDPIFMNKRRRPVNPQAVSVIWRTAGIRAGVNVVPTEKEPKGKGGRRRYPFHAHEVRDTLKTLARRARADVTVADFCIGHSIDVNSYDKSPWDDDSYFRREYDKIASAYLNLLTGAEARIRLEYDRKFEDALATRDKELAEVKAQQSALFKALRDKGVIDFLADGVQIDPVLLRLKKEDIRP